MGLAKIVRLSALGLLPLHCWMLTRIFHVHQHYFSAHRPRSAAALHMLKEGFVMNGTTSFQRKGNNAAASNKSIITTREKLQYKINRIYDNRDPGFMDESTMPHLWEISDFIPSWMKDYLSWHSTIRQNMTMDTLKAGDIKILLLYCVEETDKRRCGGLSQRLTCLPYLLKEAYNTKRLLLIHWTSPVPLTEFLVPPMGGVDWRLPKWLERAVTSSSTSKEGMTIRDTDDATTIDKAMDNATILRFQPMTDSGATLYNSIAASDRKIHSKNVDTFNDIFHDVWRIFFKPSSGIRKNIEKALRSNRGLNPANYTAIYMPQVKKPTKNITDVAQNVLNCALEFQPHSSFLLISDHPALSAAAVTHAKSQATKVFSVPAIASREQTKMLDLNDIHERNYDKKSPVLFYNVFVHLYLMAMGHCIMTSQTRGVPHLASSIAYNSSCYWPLASNCTKPLEPTAHQRKETHKQKAAKHHFGVEMPQRGTDFTISVAENRTKKLPPWMEDYFAWHAETKKKLNPDNWNSTKYLILGCLESFESCGGISDRLKPLPMVLLEAHRHRRLLLIWWERPKALEDFLIPPSNGLDWRVPAWMKDNLNQKVSGWPKKVTAGKFEQGKTLLQGGSYLVAVFFKIQTPSAGEDAFAEELEPKVGIQAPTINDLSVIQVPRDGSTYQTVFHDLFRRLFQPVPRIQEQIDQQMKEKHLIPGEYTAVHLRAMYGKRDHRNNQEIIDLAVLGLNCGSTLFPGYPVYFASDTAMAVDAAQMYATMHNLSIATSKHSHANITVSNRNNPLHIDKDPDWKTRDPSAYDSTFVDLYMIAQSRCVVYSNGGYGTFGSLLSYNSDCKMRFFKGSKKVKYCSWMSANNQQHTLEAPNVTPMDKLSS
jgi:hypothetical protein